jgi:hypothetical protein
MCCANVGAAETRLTAGGLQMWAQKKSKVARLPFSFEYTDPKGVTWRYVGHRIQGDGGRWSVVDGVWFRADDPTQTGRFVIVDLVLEALPDGDFRVVSGTWHEDGDIWKMSAMRLRADGQLVENGLTLVQ